MAWFVQLNGKVFGPLQDDQLRQLASAGKILRDTEISQQKEGPWVSASRVRGLFPDLAPAPVPAAGPAEASEFEEDPNDFDDAPPAPPAQQSGPPPVQRSQSQDNAVSTQGYSPQDNATLARIDQSISEAVDLLRNIRQTIPQSGLRNVSDYGVGDWIGIIFRAAVALIILQILLVVVGMMVFAFFAQGMRS